MRLIPFFADGCRTSASGALISEIWDWDKDKLERTHDYIQWLFPTIESSLFNKDAPIPSKAEHALLSNDFWLRTQYLRGLKLIMGFFGFALSRGRFFLHKNARQRLLNMEVNTHNYLRVTRILKSLVLFQFNGAFRAVLMAFKEYLPLHFTSGQRALRNYWQPLLDTLDASANVCDRGRSFLVVRPMMGGVVDVLVRGQREVRSINEFAHACVYKRPTVDAQANVTFEAPATIAEKDIEFREHIVLVFRGSNATPASSISTTDEPSPKRAKTD